MKTFAHILLTVQENRNLFTFINLQIIMTNISTIILQRGNFLFNIKLLILDSLFKRN